jgi:2-dehydro-3-deoxygalactonokinase
VARPDRRTEVLACGMVGARQGWIEAPYAAVPCAPLAAPPVEAPVRDPRLAVRIVPGLSQADPPDVMRGEETQIAGWLAGRPKFDGVLCLPGTHTKWVHVSAGEVVSFQTAITGELRALLTRHSVLRHSLGSGNGAEAAEPAPDPAAFEQAVTDALSRPERLATRLFALRAEGLLAGLDAATARARLTGLLIGTELAATKPYWLGRPVAVIGAKAVVEAYAGALALQGVAPERADGAAMTLAGLARAGLPVSP